MLFFLNVCLIILNFVPFLSSVNQYANNSSENIFKTCDPGITLNVDMNYCLVKRKEADCYVKRALEFVKNKTIEFPLWVQACIFTAPKSFVQYKPSYNCSINAKNGSINCMIGEQTQRLIGINHFKQTCSFAFFYLKQVAFQKGFYKSVLLGKFLYIATVFDLRYDIQYVECFKLFLHFVNSNIDIRHRKQCRT